MKKRITFITFLMLLCSVSFGQNYYTPVPVDPTVYNMSMTIATTVSFEGTVENRNNLELGVFCNGVCRATTMTKDYGTGQCIALTTFRGKSGEEYTLKVYDHNNSTEHSNYVLSDADGNEFVDNTISFNADFFGNPVAPYNVNFIAPDHFIPEIGDYQNNMTLTAVVLIDGVEQKNAKLELGAFIGDKVVGSSKTDFKYTINEERFYANQMGIAGNDNDVVTFKLYDHENGEELEFLEVNSITFETNKFLGTIAEPIKIDFLTKSYVAQIGETKYETLAAAVEAATAGQTINLRKDAKGSGVIINKNVTIDFGGFTYTFTSPAVGSNGTETQGFQILKDNDVVLKNGTLNVTDGDARTEFAMLIQNYADLTITDMTLDGDNLDRYTIKDYDYSYVLSNNSGEVSIEGETNIIANPGAPDCVKEHRGIALDACKYSSYAAPIVTVNTTGAIKGAVEVSATLNIEALGEDSEISYISIDGKGQLFHNGLTTTIKKHIKGTEAEGWYTISSPVGDVAHTDVVGLLNGTHDLYYYNEVEMMWENVKDTEDNTYTELKNGQGYLYANTVNTDLLFKGSLNTADVTYSISYTEGNNSLAGFNLIGNPFTYNITKSNMSGASLAEGFYTLSNQGAWQTNAESATIAPMQGALIKATEKTDNFTIAPNSAKRSESENKGQIKIEVSNDNYNDVAYVSFNEGIGLDKIEHRNANIPMVYVPVDGINYAIATMSQDVTEIPVYFRAMTMGQYTIGAEAQDCEYAMMTLVDRFTGIETNLLIEDYTFIAKSNDSAERFIIKLAMNNSNGEANENFAFINNGMMYIYNIEGQGTVSVYDVTGRPVAEYNVATSANISTSDFAAGMYIIRMSDENGVKTQKIVVE